MVKFKLREHLTEYLILLVSILLMVMITKEVNSFFWRLTLVFGVASFYFGYGALHHHGEGNLSLRGILDYFFMALIIFLILFSMFV